MKTGKLRIGNKGEGKHVKIPFNEPETIDEFKEVFGTNEQFLLDCSMRGVRIRIQDLTRDLVAEGLKAGKTQEAVTAEVLDFLEKTDITEKKPRQAPAPRKPVDLGDVEDKLPADVKALLMERLKAAGVKVVGQEVETATAGASA